jgi:TolB-like protein
VVEDSNLSVQISALRRALDAGRAGQSCIQTVPGRGYRFLPAVAKTPPPVLAWVTPLQSPAASLSPSEAKAIRPPSEPPRDQPPQAGASEPALMSVSFRPLMPTGDGAAAVALAAAVSAKVLSGLPAIEAAHIIDAAAADLGGIPLDAPATRIGQALGTRYVLDGTMLPGPKLAFTVRLTEATRGAVLWSETHSHAGPDADAMEAATVEALAGLRRALLKAESSRLTFVPEDRLTAPELIVMAATTYHLKQDNLDPVTQAASARAVRLLERAVALDASQVNAVFTLTAETLRPVARFEDVPDREARLDRATALVALARGLAPGHHDTLTLQALLLTLTGRCDEAEPLWVDLLRQFKGPATAMYAQELGYCLRLRGQVSEAIGVMQSVRTEANHSVGFHLELGTALYMAGQHADSIPPLRFAKLRAPVAGLRLRLVLAAALARADRPAEAARERDEGLALWPRLNLASLHAGPFPHEPTEQMQRLLAGLALAEWPMDADTAATTPGIDARLADPVRG